LQTKQNSFFENGETPLHWAARNGHLNVVEFLYNKGGNINAKNKDFSFFGTMKPLFILLPEMVIMKFVGSY